MRGMPRRVVVDTNVWLDVYLPMRRGHDTARTALEAAASRDVDLLYAPTTAKDVFYLVPQILKRSALASGERLSQEDARALKSLAWGVVDNMAEVATAVGTDASDLWLARKYRRVHDDFEDDLVIAAAQRTEADLVLTSDTALLRHSPVACMTPEDFTELVGALGRDDGEGRGAHERPRAPFAEKSGHVGGGRDTNEP